MFSLQSVWDLSILFAVISVLLIVLSEVLSPFYGKVTMRLNRKRLYYAALFAVSIFFATMALRILLILIPI